MSFNPTPEQRQALAELLFAGRKIEAIKQVRAASGLDLKDSKELIDALENELRASQPQKFAATPNRTAGCVIGLLLLLAIVGAVVWFLLNRTK
jgi:hypothetical protein